MNIASIIELQSAGQKQLLQNQNKKASFKDYLTSFDHNRTRSNEQIHDKNKEDTISLEEISLEIKKHLGDSKQETDKLDDQIQLNGSEYLSLLLTEFLQLNKNTGSVDEQVNLSSNLPGAIGILSLAHALPTDEGDDLIAIMSKLNKLFKIDFPSYSVPDKLNFKNMLYSLEQMSLEDKALLEGQLILSSADDQTIDDLKYSAQLLEHIEKTSDYRTVKDIFKGIFFESETTQNLKVLLASDDLTNIRSLMTKLVDSVSAFSQKTDLGNQNAIESGNLNESMFSIHLDKYVTKGQTMTVDGQKLASTNEEFTNQMASIIKKGRFTQFGNGTNRLVINLTPEHLGSITIKLIQQNGKMVAKIIASTESAKELLEFNSKQIQQAVPNVKVDIERFELMTDQTPRNSEDRRDSQDNKNEKESESSSEQEEDSKKSFIDSLNDALNITV